MATIETRDPAAGARNAGADSANGGRDPARAVLNQPPPLEPINLFEVDLALNEALAREGGDWGIDRVREAGAVAGSVEAREHSLRAERNLPILRTHDRYGRRIDQVELDPSWHWLLRGAVEREIHSLPWRTGAEAPDHGRHVVRAALFMQWSNANDGVMCPVSMTYSAVPALREGAPELAAQWEPRLTKSDYDTGALAGMAMTERQGGSDVRANVTRADRVGDGRFELHGHKWFCSYPPCDVFLVLAQAPGGLSCFLVERGAGMEFQRLKDKLGTRSLPSSEVEFRGAEGRLVGEEGRGVPAIIRMVNHTRLDCLLGATTGLRRGTLEAIHHARHRSAFGKLLVEQPAMRNVLADLAIESEAATVAAMRVARAYDAGEEEAAFRRFATAVMKYWVCKRAPAHAAEALECLGGNGFVEDSGMPLLYRDAPLNSIWEGSGNVAALDVLRAMVKEPEGLPAFLDECELAAGAEPRLDAHLEQVRAQASDAFAGEDPQFLARRVVEDLAVALQGSLLVRHAPPEVADAFCASRLAGEGGRVYGTLPPGIDAPSIIERALPV
jgi:putative acyl-CoA dehydrogenase